MAFLGSLFSSALPAITGLAAAAPAISGAVSSISQLVNPSSNNIVNSSKSTEGFVKNENLANSEDTGKKDKENDRLAGLVDSLLSKLGKQNEQIKHLVDATPIREVVHHVAKKAVHKVKKVSPKYEELAAALGL